MVTRGKWKLSDKASEMIRITKRLQEGGKMVIENTKSNQQLAQVIASMAIEEMYVSRDFMQELLKVSKGEKTTEELRQEVIKKYARQ